MQKEWTPPPDADQAAEVPPAPAPPFLTLPTRRNPPASLSSSSRSSTAPGPQSLAPSPWPPAPASGGRAPAASPQPRRCRQVEPSARRGPAAGPGRGHPRLQPGPCAPQRLPSPRPRSGLRVETRGKRDSQASRPARGNRARPTRDEAPRPRVSGCRRGQPGHLSPQPQPSSPCVTRLPAASLQLMLAGPKRVGDDGL